MAADRLATLPRRLLGLAMVVVMLALLVLCWAFYNKVFTRVVPVTMVIDQVDNSFLPQAEVRLRGVDVGTVTKVATDGQEATVSMALDPDKVSHIPSNVTAMLVPKSLFGERFVDLQAPANPSGTPIKAGDVITRDRSSSAVETEQLFNHLLPLIQAVRPQDLASTLGALDQALTGRGEKLGQTLTLLHEYLSKLNPALPELSDDLKALPKVTDTYTKAAPDLIQALTNLTTTSQTLVDKKDDFANLYDTLTDTSDDLYGFLKDNKENLIDLVHEFRPTAELLARYSPEYVCFFKEVSDAVQPIDQVLGKGSPRPAVNITLEIVAQRGKYVPHQDEPEFTDKRGPECYRQMIPQMQYPGGPLQDGSTHPPASGQASQLGNLTNSLAGGLPKAPSIPMLGGGPGEPSAPGGPSGGLLGGGLLGGAAGTPDDNGGKDKAPADKDHPQAEKAPVERPVAPIAYTISTDGTPSIANTRPEQQLVSGLVADMIGAKPADVPAWSSLLVGPLLRGAKVRVP
jgi:phospholipid/cholesterol/gamma-HCH transport system substrate-binding protein